MTSKIVRVVVAALFATASVAPVVMLGLSAIGLTLIGLLFNDSGAPLLYVFSPMLWTGLLVIMSGCTVFLACTLKGKRLLIPVGLLSIEYAAFLWVVWRLGLDHRPAYNWLHKLF